MCVHIAPCTISQCYIEMCLHPWCMFHTNICLVLALVIVTAENPVFQKCDIIVRDVVHANMGRVNFVLVVCDIWWMSSITVFPSKIKNIP